jgi:hypothetical protein
MSTLSHLKKESMHHAFVVEGDIKASRPALFDFLKSEFSMDLGHNDLVLLDRGDFGIDNVQEIIDINSRKPTVGIYKVVVVILNSISHQAQNAILKTLEEPRPGTFIFILTNTSAIFLPTILSRVQVVRGNTSGAVVTNGGAGNAIGAGGAIGEGKAVDTKQSKKDASKAETLDAEIFIKNSLSERLAQVKEIMELKSDEEIGDAEIFAFVQEVEKLAHDNAVHNAFIDTSDSNTLSGALATSTASIDQNAATARIFTKVSDYMRDTSSSKKLLLEYVALRLPIF